jgi:hypothetical protein
MRIYMLNRKHDPKRTPRRQLVAYDSVPSPTP